MKIVALIALVLCVVVPLDAAYQSVSDYYWRPLHAEIPRDALRVHKDCESPIHIGQAWFKEGLLPSALYGNVSEVVASADKRVLKTTSTIKILCTPHPQLYKWVQTTSKTFDDLKKECELVSGGEEAEHNLYIGRQLVDGKIQIGKIYKYPSRELVLPVNNEKRYQSYEILTFNCKKSC